MAPVADMDVRLEAQPSPSSADRPIYAITEPSYPTLPPPPTGYQETAEYQGHVPLIIDNGSSELRAGYATDPSPRLAYDNIVSRYRERKGNRNFLLMGNDAYVDASARSNVRSPFDGDVVCSIDVLENILDYTFINLGIDTSSVEHPILISETLCNPSYSRSLTSELLFECYQVPSVAYGLDSLFSLYQNGRNDGLVVSSARASTQVIPVLDGKGLLANAKRLPWGGAHASEFMLKLIQLKYPTFPTRMTTAQSNHLVQSFCYVSEDYDSEIRHLSSAQGLAEKDVIVQFPFVMPERDEKTEEELARQAERRKESGRRLQEQTQRLRLEKLVQKENDLQYYLSLREYKNQERKADFLKRLESEGFDSEQELENIIKKTEQQLKRARNRDMGIDEEEEKEAPTFPLLEVPDHQLNEEDLKEKRKQRLMKANYDARIRAKAEKLAEKARVEEERRKDEDQRTNDPQSWLARVRQQHADVVARVKERKRLKEQLSDRKSLAAQQRMKNITSLAADQPGARKRKRGGDEDTFGANDDDWAIYREIRGADDSEDEEEETSVLKDVEEKLLAHDPTFTMSSTYDSQMAAKHRLTTAFVRGSYPAWDPEDFAQSYQIHLNVERIRVPEVLFQPSIAGVDHAGVAELVGHVLKGYQGEARDKLTKNIFLTGGHTSYRNFSSRLSASVRSILPVDAPISVVSASDVRFDAWRGMAKWAAQEPEAFRTGSVTKEEYAEKGSEYFKEHRFGNWV